MVGLGLPLAISGQLLMK